MALISIGIVAVSGSGAGLRPASSVVTRSERAQPPQNLSSGGFTAPHDGQPPGSPLPQPPQ